MLVVDAISEAPQYGWGATRTIGVLAATAVLLAAFLLIERRVTDPLLPLSIFRVRTLTGANTARLLLGGSFHAFIFVGTLCMQQVLHYSALQCGLAWLAASLTSIAALAGVKEQRAGLASGLLNTSQQLGGAIGIAIASSVAASRTQTLLHTGHAAPAPLTGGFQQALWVLGGIGLLAIPAIFALARREAVPTAVAKTTVRDPQPALAATS